MNEGEKTVHIPNKFEIRGKVPYAYGFLEFHEEPADEECEVDAGAELIPISSITLLFYLIEYCIRHPETTKRRY